MGAPYPRWAEVGRQWGCDPLVVQAARQANYRADRPEWWQPTPEVGWTACELLARNGSPDRVDHVRTAAAQADNLFYRDPAAAPGEPKTHLVTLEPAAAGWRVSAVVW
jgi:hypothetical protein